MKKILYILLSALIGQAAVYAATLQSGELLTAPLMLSTIGAAQNIMITIDNAPSSTNEVAWTQKNQIPTINNSTLFQANSIVKTLNPFLISSNRVIATPSVGYDNNIFTAIHRSHYTNPAYYNPDWRYDPWNKLTYSSYLTQYPANQAPINFKSDPSLTVDLTLQRKYETSNWSEVTFNASYTPAMANAMWIGLNGTMPTNLSDTFTLATYFNYIGAPTSNNFVVPLQNSLTIADFQKIEININAAYTKSSQRSDCVSLANLCTGAEELQNFSNWFVYHRNRLNAQIGMATWALSRLGEHYRIGLTLTNKGVGIIDGLPQANVVLGVRGFSGSNRSTFFSTLQNVSTNASSAFPGSNAPLRTTIFNVGEYFKRTDAYSETPGSSGGTISSCRKSENFTFTNGNYSDELSTSLPYSATSAESKGPTAVSPSVTVLSGNSSGAFSFAPLNNQSQNSAESPTSTLAYLSHSLYWKDLLPTLNDNYAYSSIGLPSGFSGVSYAVNSVYGDIVTSQNLKNNYISFSVPGKIPFNYNIYSDLYLSSSNSSGTTFNNLHLQNGWNYTTGSYSTNLPINSDRDFSDDLLRASFNSSSKYIYTNSRDNKHRLQPRAELLYRLARNTFKWSESAHQSDSTVMEEYNLQGVPQIYAYNAGRSSLRSGSILGQDASGLYQLGASSVAAANGVTNFRTEVFYAENTLLNQIEQNTRNVYLPIFSSNTSPVTSVVKLQKSTSNLQTNYSAVTSYMQSLMGSDSYPQILDYVQGSSVNENVGFNDMYDEQGLDSLDDFKSKQFKSRRNTDGTNVYSTLLGSLFGSHPTVVRMHDFAYAFDNSSIAQSYKSFLQTKRNNPQRLVFGTNDGLFHVFNGVGIRPPFTFGSSASNTEELAYIPAGVISKLKNVVKTDSAYLVKGLNISDPDFGFTYTVDGPTTTGDIYDGSSWRSYVTGSLGNGGKGLFSVDVTTNFPLNAASILWDKTHPGQWGADWADVGHIRNRAGIFKMPNGTFATIFGNGAKSSAGSSTLFILDATTGALIKKITTPASSENGLMGLSFLFNDKREVITIYGGDLKGNLWKFDTSSTSTGAWGLGNSGSPLFVARSASGDIQPITTKPMIYPHTEKTGNLIIFGTGSSFRYKDPGLSVVHSIYGVWDEPNVTGTIATSSLQPQSISAIQGSVSPNSSYVATTSTVAYNFRTLTNNPVDYSAKKGWYFNLPATSNGFVENTTEALTSDMKVVANRINYATATPPGVVTSPNTCSFNDLLTSTQGTFNPLTGGRLEYTVYDTNGDGKIDVNDNPLVSSFYVKSTGYANYNVGVNTAGLNVTNTGGRSTANAVGTLPITTRTGSGYVLLHEGELTSRARKDALKSWRELSPR